MLDRKKIARHLKTTLFGRNLFLLEEIDSTNKYAMQLARDGVPEGTVVCAAFQTAGRGRFERNWYASPGENLLISVIVRPKQNIELVQRITLAVSVILLESTRDFLKKYGYTPLDMRLKWPNDLMVGSKKLAGILTESLLKGKAVEALVIGIGINLNFQRDNMPQEIRDTATSIRIETGKHVDVSRFFTHFLYDFEQAYERLERTDYADVAEHWKKYNQQLGQDILIRTMQGEERGRFMDVNAEGHLIYEDETGNRKELLAGEIING